MNILAKNKLVLIGGGGHCESCLSVLSLSPQWEVVGILERSDFLQKQVCGIPVIGTDDDIKTLAKDHYFLITLGQQKNAQSRKNIGDKIASCGGRLATVISPLSHISPYATIGAGTIVMHNCLINNHATIGENCIINNFSNIEHDVTIGNYCHISTGVMVNGSVVIGEDCFIGSGATLVNDIKITSRTVIGAGAVVIKDINKDGIYVGNPAKEIKNKQ